jgi:hypothetical protein
MPFDTFWQKAAIGLALPVLPGFFIKKLVLLNDAGFGMFQGFCRLVSGNYTFCA